MTPQHSSNDKDLLFAQGVRRAQEFCALNSVPMPAVTRLSPADRLYQLGTCAFYRRHMGIVIMVEKCASRGLGGRAWSWPGYCVDRTPYGVVQHELGHHVDEHFSKVEKGVLMRHLAADLHQQSGGEEPLTGYLGTDARQVTFYMEWFAEIFRLFVTNPDLCRRVRPRSYAVITAAGLKPLASPAWDVVLASHQAPERIVSQARKKIGVDRSESLFSECEQPTPNRAISPIS